MHAVIENSDSSFFQYWDKLCANDPLQDPIYSQQHGEFRSVANASTGFIDRSFLVMSEEEPVFGCSLTSHKDEQGRRCIGYFGREASIQVNRASIHASNNNFQAEAVRLLQARINQLIEEIQPHAINYLDPVSCGVMSPVTQLLLEKGGVPVVQKAQIIDLSLTDNELLRNMTKTCRGFLEWGRKNLDIRILDSQINEGCDHSGAAMQFLREMTLEEKIAANLESTYEEILKRGNGFLVQGHYKGELVSSSLFVHNSRSCQYVLSAMNTKHVDRPLLHAPVWEAMKQARSLTCAQFDFGSNSVPCSSDSSKTMAASCFGGESHSRLRVSLER